VESISGADSLIERIRPIADRAPMRLDGELLFPFGHAVQWYEWFSGTEEVITKTMNGVAMMRREALFA